MSKFRLITFGGWHWLAVEVEGRVHLLYRKGRVGDCISL